MTPLDLAKIGVRIDRAEEHLPYLLEAMDEFEINTPERRSAFMAQVLHESGMLHWMVELWGPTPAQTRYEGRTDLGNNKDGDGYRFRGRGLIQITGRDNYRKAGQALGIDLWSYPELLGQSPLAERSAAWFWSAHGCNEIADSGDFVKLTKRINGGDNGLAERLRLWELIKEFV